MSNVMRRLTITPVLNGFIVEVGCQTLVFKTMSELTDALTVYHSDPDATEKMFIRQAVNKTMNNEPAPRHPTAVRVDNYDPNAGQCEAAEPRY